MGLLFSLSFKDVLLVLIKFSLEEGLLGNTADFRAAKETVIEKLITIDYLLSHLQF